MAIDITGLIVLSLFFIRGYSKGLIVAAFSVIAILLGLLCALKLSQSFAAWLLLKGYTTTAWAPAISYVLLFTGVVLGVRLLGKLLQRVVEGVMLGMVNKLAGGVLYAFAGAVFFSSVLWISARMNMLSPELIATSKTYIFFSAIAPWFFSVAGTLLPFAKDVFNNLQHFFDVVAEKAAAPAGG
ncbi:MAG: CvpA family protein [Taibaiella sp.]|nr:CvpA family protein [Taibaiella sp.]